MPEIQKVRYTHDALIDEILINPSVSQREMARMFGFTEAWMSIMVNSEAFQERLAERKGILIDPAIRASIAERLDAVAKRSLDRIMERLDSPSSGSIKNGDLVAMAKLGVGDRNNRPTGPQTQNNLYVVALPAPAENAQSWLDSTNRTSRVIPSAEDPAPVEVRIIRETSTPF